MADFNVQFEFNTSKVDAVLNSLNGREAKQVMKKALSHGAQLIVKDAKKNLRSETKAAKSKLYNYTHTKRNRNLKRNKQGVIIGAKSLEQGIRYKIHMDEGDPMAKINIMGDFRLNWLEKGTKQRFHHNHKGSSAKASAGQMPKWFFFKKAIEQDSAAAEKRIKETIEAELQKIWLKKI